MRICSSSSCIQKERRRAGTGGRVARWMTAVVATLCVAPAALAQTGVSDDRVSLPDGPGSLAGVGDNASVDANMGLMRYAVDLDVPAGFPAATPELAIAYSSTWGNGVAGMGWSLDLPYIERMTLRELPHYDEDDDFATLGGEQLIRVEDGEPAAYRARMERSFVRYSWHDRGNGTAGYWTAEAPDGSVEFYGANSAGDIIEEARVSGPDGVFRYLVAERVDVLGHRVAFRYGTFGDIQLVERIEYVFDDDGQPRHLIELEYELRQDRVSDCRGAFEERLEHRLTDVVVTVEGTELRRYVLSYEDYDEAGGFSRLQRVEHFGVGGARHPTVLSFAYSRALGGLCDRSDCDGPRLVTMGSLGVDLQVRNATLVDLNGDSLPDVVDTTIDGPHRIYLSALELAVGGAYEPHFQSGISSQYGTSGSHRLSSPHVQILDIDGDGFADLLNRQTGQVLPNLGRGDWGPAETLGGDVAADLPDFGEGFDPGDEELAHVRFFDYDGDRRIDVIRSQEDNTEIYANLGDHGFQAVPGVEAIGAGFADTGMRLEDLNGDGLLDPVILRPGELAFKLNLGRGRWDPEWTSVTGLSLSDAELPLAELVDINGDSLADLVVVQGREVRYSLNRNAGIFDAPRYITTANGGALPERTAETTVLFADMDGNGSEDVVWIDPSGAVTFLEVFPVRPNLLARIENGLGMVTEVTYASSVEHMARDGGAEGWAHPLPLPMVVVDSIDTWEAINEVHQVARYRYHDGFYDGHEKRFRGYARVEMTVEGDEWQEPALTESQFDVGADDPYRAGLLLRQAILALVEGEPEPLSVSETAYADCRLSGVPIASEMAEPIRYVCAVGSTTTHQERRPAAEWVTTETTVEYDGYGNVVFQAEHGVTAIGGGGCEPCSSGAGEMGPACEADCHGDEGFVETDFVSPTATGDRWILNRPYRVRRFGRLESDLYAEERMYYDGRPLGELTSGLRSQVTMRVDPDREDFIFGARTRYDTHGNPIEEIAPNGEPGGSSHRRLITWDADGLFAEQIDVLLESPEGEPYGLRYRLAHDRLHGRPSEIVGPILVVDGAEIDPPAPTRLAYDSFGRLVARTEPGDEPSSPTHEWEWQLGVPAACSGGSGSCPVNSVTHRQRSVSGAAAPDLESVSCFDGLGRRYQERTRIDGNRYQVTGFSVFNRRGSSRALYAPFVADGAACDLTPPDGVEAIETRLDALGREVAVLLPDGDVYGDRSERRTVYEPLQVWAWDEQDSDPDSPHANTPSRSRRDGLGRLIEIEEQLLNGDQRAFQYRYDELGHLSSLTDPDGNLTTYQHDLLGRMLRADDPNRGTVTATWDAAGNRLTWTDSSGVSLETTYDGANRPVATWDVADPDSTRVAQRYDWPLECPASTCTYAAGQLVEVEYPLEDERGGLWLGYDDHRRQVYAGRHIGELLLELRTEYDDAGRPTAQYFPAGRRLEQSYDGLGRVTAVAGLIDAIEYAATGALAEVQFANGVVTSYAFDGRQRLSSLAVRDPGDGRILDYSYRRDRVGNIVSIDDARDVDQGPRGGAELEYDALYQLVQADLDAGEGGATETLEFGYSPLRNLTSLRSSLGTQSRAHLGQLRYDSESGPQALTRAGNRVFEYDDMGFLAARGDEDFVWDAFGRLVAVRRGSQEVARFAYGADQQRVMKREGAQVTHYALPGYELRDGITWLDVRVGDQRLARVAADDLAARILSDVAPASLSGGDTRPDPDGRITAADGWMSQAVSVGELSIATPSLSDARQLLASSARRLLLRDGERCTFQHRDHAGSLTAVTDISGSVVERFEYYPYGGLRHSQTGEPPSYGYADKELDASTGLVYFGFRYYDPAVGRFISPDVAFEVPGQNTFERPVEAAAPYLYALANPVGYGDSDGRWASALALAVGLVTPGVGLLGGAVAGYQYARMRRFGRFGTGLALLVGAVGGLALSVGAGPGAWVVAGIAATVWAARSIGSKLQTLATRVSESSVAARSTIQAAVPTVGSAQSQQAFPPWVTALAQSPVTAELTGAVIRMARDRGIGNDHAFELVGRLLPTLRTAAALRRTAAQPRTALSDPTINRLFVNIAQVALDTAQTHQSLRRGQRPRLGAHLQ